jgi:hypothetical protein
MPSEYKGRTRLGKSLNKIANKTDETRTGKANVRYGILAESVNNLYIYRIKIFKVVVENGKKKRVVDYITGPIPLSETLSTLTALAGDPSELIGEEVQIKFYGDSPDRGVASLINNSSGAERVEKTLQANQLTAQGAAFARPA